MSINYIHLFSLGDLFASYIKNLTFSPIFVHKTLILYENAQFAKKYLFYFHTHRDIASNFHPWDVFNFQIAS